MNRYWLVGATLLIAAAPVLLITIGQSPREATPRIPDDAGLAQFQRMADQACKCTRRHGRTAEAVRTCWASFDKATDPYVPTEIQTGCMLGTNNTSVLCFGELGQSEIMTGKAKCIVLIRSTPNACTAQEQYIVAAILAGRAKEDGSPEAHRATDVKIADAMKGLDRGEPVALPKPTGADHISHCLD